MTFSAVLALAVLAAAPDSGSAQERPAAFAVVVGSTRPDRPGLATLRYADDDAARWYEALSLFADVELLTVLDGESQERHPHLAARARPPTRKELGAALARTKDRIERAKKEGRQTSFYFVFAGHGDVGENNEGYLVLLDGRFTRADLYREVISVSPADATHVILDACRAWFMVSKRGSDASKAIRDVLDLESLERWPNVGVLVATTQSAEVHEWSRWTSGVFSHEVRSAFLGGADVDGDGGVTYLEAGAFLAAANSKVVDPRAKLSVAAIPPRADRGAKLVSWSGVDTATFLHVSADTPESMFVEDERGVRTADLHLAGVDVTLALPPDREYHLRGDGWEASFAARAGERIELANLLREKPETSTRGSVAVAFERGLFALPFDRGFYDGWVAANPRGAFPPRPLTARRDWNRPAGWSSAGLAALAAAGTAWSLREARTDAERYRIAFGSQSEVDSLRRSARRHEREAAVLGGVSLVSTAASGYFLWKDRRSAIAFEPAGGGGRVSLVISLGGEP